MSNLKILLNKIIQNEFSNLLVYQIALTLVELYIVWIDNVISLLKTLILCAHAYFPFAPLPTDGPIETW